MRAQDVCYREFEREKDALSASLIEHIECGRDPEQFFASLAEAEQ